jgi:hypothetical protein
MEVLLGFPEAKSDADDQVTREPRQSWARWLPNALEIVYRQGKSGVGIGPWASKFAQFGRNLVVWVVAPFSQPAIFSSVMGLSAVLFATLARAF